MRGDGRTRTGALSREESETLRYYQRSAREWDQSRDVSGFWDDELRAFSRLLPPPARVLDLGCGSGRTLAPLLEAGYDPVGLDASSEMLALARKAHPEAELIEASLYEIPIADGGVDGVWSVAALLHVPKRRLPAALKELARVIRSGGAALISVKAGSGEGLDPDGRFFARYQLGEFKSAFGGSSLDLIDVSERTADGDDWIIISAAKR